MQQSTIISASILNADLARLGEEVSAILEAGANWVHLDIMDNHYVPNLTFGPSLCAALRQFGIQAPIDVHLMTNPVDSLIMSFAKAGANMITIHPEATHHIDRSIALIRNHGCQAGLALNPSTPLSYLDYLWDKLDLILVMSVNPGFGGQRFIPAMLKKIHEIRKLIDQHQLPIRLAVDGGVKLDNIGEIAKMGADTYVIGSALFDTEDYTTILHDLQNEIKKANGC